MAENKTPVTMKVKDFAEREVLLVNYDFSQETDREGQVSGIPRGGRLKIRVKALNDGNPGSRSRAQAATAYTIRSIGATARSTTRKSPSFARSWRTDPLLSKIPGNKIHTIGTQRPEAHRFRLFSFQIKPSAAICVKKENID